eukprot:2771386-Prymnesium_polylepis.1
MPKRRAWAPSGPQEDKRRTDLPPRLFVAAKIQSGATSLAWEVPRPFIKYAASPSCRRPRSVM